LEGAVSREHRVYKTVEVEMWDDLAFRELTPLEPGGQALWLYLLTGRRTTKIPGVIIARPAVLADDLRWDAKAFAKAFAEVLSEGLAKADTKAGLIWLPRALRHRDGTARKSTKPTNPNRIKGWAKGWDRVPDCELKVEVWRELKAFAKALGKAFEAAFAESFAALSQIQVAGSREQVAGSREQEICAPGGAQLLVPDVCVPRFDLAKLYDLYPRKRNRKRGLEAAESEIQTQGDYSAALAKMTGLELAWRHVPAKDQERAFIPHFTTYVRGRCWEDEDQPIPKPKGSSNNRGYTAEELWAMAEAEDADKEKK
jgi:hypothetical protein